MNIRSAIHDYLNTLYKDVMDRAYQKAKVLLLEEFKPDALYLDCGAGNGSQYQLLASASNQLSPSKYFGIEWDLEGAMKAKKRGLQLVRADLNRPLPFEDDVFGCVFGLSVLEHLVNGCQFMKEAYRVFKPDGRMVLITPNLSAWFNVMLLIFGKMPSSGPHPDSSALVRKNTAVRFRDTGISHVEDAIPTDRHLVVFTYKALRYYLHSLGFNRVTAYTYGLYPLPRFVQPFFERIDPWHCHQMLFDCQK
jgi:SAM-dependent methyltransferase